MNISFKEYQKKLMDIRKAINTLIDDIGGTYNNAPEMLEKVLNVALNGDIYGYTKGKKILTRKIISVEDFTRPGFNCEVGKHQYM